ncbi:MAG: DUF3667 domain-containing protein [Alphaproteobacteria bacterium]|nr:DUF3667 domain-containing protein [Alphaproteobacteria bacterium]MBU1515926.1 DUF3667 domain-containing protein [Alphaproteobacteria bacterium]MBU2094148.1 DUF3667 domain-containing protein [Alphaproteobacteria bacterium]MBU2151500.1 DUF3667 domain-containing protein [Alphaproteobacteria bacterium]MBU2305224.1 DUF3667 domain-containing protein [Alphaproteobacteria bacterium]
MVDLEALGGAATGGLIASQFEKPTGQTGEHDNACADCGTETVGPFCHNCGNPSHVHRTLLHLGEELLHGVMHFDSRTWRTLPLLVFRPGRLTREWSLGKRTRYVSPLAMFLFTMFVMFMALSYAPEPKESTLGRQAVATADLARKNTDVANARAALNTAPPAAHAAAEAALKAAQAEQAKANARIGNTPKAAEVDGWEEDLAHDAKSGKFKVNIGNGKTNQKLSAKLNHKLENPELALYKLQQTFYKFSFLLIPISIPFVALLFVWKRGFTLYDHGVFVLYSLTFMSLLAMVVGTCTRIGGFWGAAAIAVTPFIVPVHMYYQLQGAYGLRTFSALWRTVFLLVFCSIALTFFLLAIIMLNLA